jgi:hypothetical protein
MTILVKGLIPVFDRQLSRSHGHFSYPGRDKGKKGGEKRPASSAVVMRVPGVETVPWCPVAHMVIWNFPKPA